MLFLYTKNMKFTYLSFIFVSLGAIWAPVSYAADLNEGKETEFFELLENINGEDKKKDIIELCDMQEQRDVVG